MNPITVMQSNNKSEHSVVIVKADPIKVTFARIRITDATDKL